MNSNQMHKVAGFINKARELIGNDPPDSRRVHRGLGFGAAGAALGGAGGYLNAAHDFAGTSLAHPQVLGQLFNRPGAVERLMQISRSAPSLKNTLLTHSMLLPAIAKASPRRLALPALAAGGVAGLLGLSIPNKA